MYRNLDDFLSAYTHESSTTQRVLEALSDETLKHEKAAGDTSIGELAWHIATAPGYMLAHEGLDIKVEHTPPANVTKQQIVDEFKRVNAACIEGCKAKLGEADLTRTANWFGYELPLGVWLNMVPNHEVHHRGQLSAMMRNAGLQVPSIYGPNKEEFEEMMKSGKFGNPEAAAQG
jgi:uncharacterized damage-inducible protein DinB